MKPSTSVISKAGSPTIVVSCEISISGKGHRLNLQWPSGGWCYTSLEDDSSQDSRKMAMGPNGKMGKNGEFMGKSPGNLPLFTTRKHIKLVSGKSWQNI